MHLIEIYKGIVVYDKPIYVGTSILELSKLCMVKFHYEVIYNNFKDNYNLLNSDTDSFVYSIQHDDIYECIKNNKEYIVLSDSQRPDSQDIAVFFKETI